MALAGSRLDFADAAVVFASAVAEWEDTRQAYGERRMLCVGRLLGRLVVVGYVQRGQSRHIFTMRKANEREQVRFRQ